MTEPLKPTDKHASLFNEGTGGSAPQETEQVPPEPSAAPERAGILQPGQRVQDFVILRQLGRGSFARVYLAQQVSLDRQVALKVSDRPAIGEALTLAGLEHDHIVKVYSEFVDPPTRMHCLCLQYVPGTTLAHVIERLYEHGRPNTGSAFVAAIDELSSGETGFDPAAAHHREQLLRLPFVEVVCRLGAQLAEALAFAHARGILHCDVKPANILLNRYGRPLLADFNVSVQQVPDQEQRLGGTLDYMAPEHLAIFTRLAEQAERVDHRADIYSLGVVLFEMAAGRLPFVRETRARSSVSLARNWLEQRARFPADTGIPEPLERVLRRCLEPQLDKRYQNGVELAQALQNAGDIMAARRRLPRGGRLARYAERQPFRVLVLLTFLPHLLGSVVNITYNMSEIRLNDEQKAAFLRAILLYNGIVYPLCLGLAYRVIRRVWRGWREVAQGGGSGPALDYARGRALGMADWGIGLACAGWFPGALCFPLMIDALAGPVPLAVYAHFTVSFFLSGLIALIYSHFGIQFVALRVLYPRLGNPDGGDRANVVGELARAGRWFDLFQCLAAVVPLSGAVLLVLSAPEHLTPWLRLLMTALIVLGMLGVFVAVVVRYRLNEVIQTLAGGRGESVFPSDTSRG